MIRVKKLPVLHILTLLTLLMAVPPLFASDTKAEIQYLLQTIEQSGCLFKRNWSEYSAQEARSHMEMKYDYAKDKITQTEQFIQYIATQSSITGKEYIIRCDGIDYPSAKWLTDKLEDYRSSKMSENAQP